MRRAVTLVLTLVSVVGCASPAARPELPATGRSRSSVQQLVSPEAEPWQAASDRFHDNGAWLGADSAYSIDLDDTRVLWLFADTFLDPSGDGTRVNGPNYFIRNSLGVQSGPDRARSHDLARSTLRFYWGPVRDGAPTSFFHDVDGSERWAWPLHGARLPGGELLLFRMLVVKDTGGFGFRVESWDALAVDDPTTPPDTWQPRPVQGPEQRFGKLLGSSVLVSGEHLYAYGVDNQGKDHAIYLARWSLAKLAHLPQGALGDPEWWTGSAFVAQSALPPGVQPGALWQDGQVELSVHFEPERQRFVELQMQGLFVSEARTQLGMRTAPRPQGPWSTLEPFYRPVESALPNAGDLAAYAGKAHPEQRGADLVLTYVVNDLKRFPPQDAVYYPQVLRLTYRALSADAGSE